MSDSLLPAWCRIVREVTPELLAAFAAAPAIRGPKDAAEYLAPRLGQEEVEVFVVVALNAQARVVAMHEVTRGLVNSTLVAPREVFRLAIAVNAVSIIVAHNHPSGELTPSREDMAVTEQLIAAGALLDIPVRDHLIIGSDPEKFTSFAEAGLM